MKKVTGWLLMVCMIANILPVGIASAYEYQVSSVIYSQDFEGIEEDRMVEDIDVIGNKDYVFVKSTGASKRLRLMNNNDVAGIAVCKKFDGVSNKTLVAQLEYLQIATKSDNNTALSLRNDTTPAVSIETLGGNIIYRTGSGDSDYIKLVENYFVNKPYNIKAVADLYTNKCKVYIDEELIGEYDFLNSTAQIDNFYCEAKYSPGFAIDNLYFATEDTATNVDLTGDVKPVIPAYGSQEYIYSATVTNKNGVTVENVGIDWSITPQKDAVQIERISNNKVKLIVKDTAQSEDFVIKAVVQGTENNLYGSITVTPQNLSASRIKISGWEDGVKFLETGEVINYPSFRMTSTDRETNQYDYSVKTYDQFGNEVADYGNFKWELFPVNSAELPVGVSINQSTGVVTVSGYRNREERVKLKVTSMDNPSMVDEQILLVSDYDRYVSDKERFESVIGHLESVLKYASVDTSPLLSDLISKKTGDPGTIPLQGGSTISSNLMAQNNLMCAMVNISRITGNPKYEDRVNAIYHYMLENCVQNDTLIWGGHMTMNLFTNRQAETNMGGTHEIKGVSPYMAPFFNKDVNIPNPKLQPGESDVNKNGWAGYLTRTLFAGHAAGDLESLTFERHYKAHQKQYNMEEEWQHPELFDSERRGPAIWEGGGSFLIVIDSMISILMEYYDCTGDEYAFKWAENCMNTLINSAFTYYVYKDNNGELIYPSNVNANNKRKFLNRSGQLLYLSKDEDTNELYEDRIGHVNCVDMSGNDVVLQLYNSWTEGIWGSTLATTKGLEYKLPGLDQQLGRPWYEMPNIDNYTGPQYGDRVWNNFVYGEENWVSQGYITEEESDFILEPFSLMQSTEPLSATTPGFCTLIEKFAARGDVEKAKEYADKFSKAMYNYAKLRYDFSSNSFLSYFSWIRPSKVRELGLTGYTETEPDEELDKSRYLRANIPSPHRGYVLTKGEIMSGKKPEVELIEALARIVYTSKKIADIVEDSDAECAERLRKRSSFIWKVLRDLCLDQYMLGDIGEDFNNPKPKLNLATTADSEFAIYGFLYLYRSTGIWDYLDFARVIANNLVSAQYSKDEMMYLNGSDYYVSSSNKMLQIILMIEGCLIDRYEDYMQASPIRIGREFEDFLVEQPNGRFDYNTAVLTAPSTICPNVVVKVKKLNITDDVIEMKVGETRKINYKIAPFDADTTSVYWDVYDKKVAIMDEDNDTLYAIRPGKTKIRCIAKGGDSVTDEVTVIVK